jgi:hypothetical protein
MFTLLVYSNAISVMRTHKFRAARAAVGFAGLVELIIKIGSIAETTHFFGEISARLLGAH